MGDLPTTIVVPQDFETLSFKRAERARVLSERHPASRDALLFYREICGFQQTVARTLETRRGASTSPGAPQRLSFDLGAVVSFRQPFVDLVLDKAPDPLQRAAKDLDEASCREALEDYVAQRETTSPRSFFARVLLQPWVAASPPNPGARASNRCPHCGHPPQVVCRRPQGDGTALSLVCSLCLTEWPFARGHCPACGLAEEKKLVYYAAPEIEHLQVQVCESCRKYLHQVNFAKDPEAVPDVDEIAALPLDVWAGEQGFRKLHPNLVGM